MSVMAGLSDRVENVEMTEEKVEVLNSIRQSFIDVLEDVDDSLPDSREKSVVVTKLEEAWLWVRQCVEQNDVP